MLFLCVFHVGSSLFRLYQNRLLDAIKEVKYDGEGLHSLRLCDFCNLCVFECLSTCSFVSLTALPPFSSASLCPWSIWPDGDCLATSEVSVSKLIKRVWQPGELPLFRLIRLILSQNSWKGPDSLGHPSSLFLPAWISLLDATESWNPQEP